MRILHRHLRYFGSMEKVPIMASALESALALALASALASALAVPVTCREHSLRKEPVSQRPCLLLKRIELINLSSKLMR